VFDAISDLPSLRSGEETNRYLSPPQNDYQKERRQNAENFVTLHVAAKHSEKMQHIMSVARGSKLDLPEGLVTSGFSSCYSRMAANEPATTITVKFTSPASSKCIHPYQDRAITPREAARLQGFDDNFVFAGSKTDIASQIGNAVPPLLGTALAPLFIEQLS
jgi:DNA (cytosine-5)-methyltransferase 1